MSAPFDDELESVVIDTGSFQTKSGFAGDDCHRSFISTVIGRHDYHSWMVGMDGKDSYVGSDAQYKRGLLSLKYPVNRGVITDWDNMEEIWGYIFNSELNISPKDRPVLMTERPLNPTSNRERMIETMFETFDVPLFYVAMQPILTMYSNGGVSAILFECGDGASDVMTVYEGRGIKAATKRIPFAGCDLTNYLSARLNERGNSFTTLSDMEVVRDIKEKCCYVASDFESEIRTFDSSVQAEKKYELPDGRIIAIGSEQFRCSEGLFKPDLLGKCSDGIQNHIFDSLMKCDIDTRRDLFANIVISGGTTMLPGFAERLQEELKQLVPRTMKVKVVAPPERRHSTWIGGSILASLYTFQQSWVTKSEYDDHGPSIVHSKCITL